jgi:hypothetical protein
VKNADRAKLIVEALIEDLSDRRGLRHEWESIDEDIQEEIRQTWITIVLSRLKA